MKRSGPPDWWIRKHNETLDYLRQTHSGGMVKKVETQAKRGETSQGATWWRRGK